jgi:hypothetical protein
MQQVQSLTFAQFLIDVDEVDLTDNLAGLQRKPGTGTHQSTTTNNADFHNASPCFSGSLCFVSFSQARGGPC